MTKIIQYNNLGEYIHSKDGETFSKNIFQFERRAVRINRNIFDSSRKRVSQLRNYRDIKRLGFDDIIDFFSNDQQRLSREEIDQVFEILRDKLTEAQSTELQALLEEMLEDQTGDTINPLRVELVANEGTNLSSDNPQINLMLSVYLNGNLIVIEEENTEIKWYYNGTEQQDSRNEQIHTINRRVLSVNEIINVRANITLDDYEAQNSINISRIDTEDIMVDESLMPEVEEIDPENIRITTNDLFVVYRASNNSWRILTNLTNMFANLNNSFNVFNHEVNFRVNNDILQYRISGNDNWESIMGLRQIVHTFLRRNERLPSILLEYAQRHNINVDTTENETGDREDLVVRPI